MASSKSAAGAAPPNFFIAVPLTNSEIVVRIWELQTSWAGLKLPSPWDVPNRTSIFKETMIPPAKLHLTLSVMRLTNEQEIRKAHQILKEVGSEIHADLVHHPLELKIQGVGSFGGSTPTVIFAETKSGIERLDRMRDVFQKKFNEVLGTPIDRRSFHPHITIAKIIRSKKLSEKGIRSFPPEMLHGVEETYFGIERVTKLQLLQMGGEDRATGGYISHGNYSII